MHTKTLDPSAWSRLLARHDLPVHLRRALERGVTSLFSRGIRYRLAGSYAERNADAIAKPKPTKPARPAKAKPVESACARLARAAAASAEADTEASHTLRLVASTPQPRTAPHGGAASARVARLASDAADRALRDDDDSTLPPAA